MHHSIDNMISAQKISKYQVINPGLHETTMVDVFDRRTYIRCQIPIVDKTLPLKLKILHRKSES